MPRNTKKNLHQNKVIENTGTDSSKHVKSDPLGLFFGQWAFHK